MLVNQLPKIKKDYKNLKEEGVTYGYFKDLPRRTSFNKILRGKAIDIGKNPKYNGYQRGIATIFFNFLIKRLLLGLLHVEIKLLSKVKLCQTCVCWTYLT